MKVTINIKDRNFLLALAKLLRKEDDAKSKIAVEVAAEKARDATTYIGCQFSDGQQMRLAMFAIEKVLNKLKKQNDNESK